MRSDSKKLIILSIILLVLICLIVSFLLYLVAKREKTKLSKVCDNCNKELDLSKKEKVCPNCFAPINEKYNNDIYSCCVFFACYLIVVAIILLGLVFSNWQFVF